MDSKCFIRSCLCCPLQGASCNDTLILATVEPFIRKVWGIPWFVSSQTREVVVCVQFTLLFELARRTEPERIHRDLMLLVYHHFPYCASDFKCFCECWLCVKILCVPLDIILFLFRQHIYFLTLVRVPFLKRLLNPKFPKVGIDPHPPPYLIITPRSLGVCSYSVIFHVWNVISLLFLYETHKVK